MALLATALVALLAIVLQGAHSVTLVPLIEAEVLPLDFATTTLAMPFLALTALVVPAVAFWGLTRGASQLGALCILTALALLGEQVGSFRFADIAQSAASLPMGLRSATVGLALIGFGSKAGLVPLHFWLPLAHPVAPANASALLSSIMLKVAVYGLLLDRGVRPCCPIRRAHLRENAAI
jgi:hypothetical protein